MPNDDSGSVDVVNLVRMLTRLGMKTTIAAIRERNSPDAGVAVLARILGPDHNVEAISTVAPSGA
ncbi:MAG: hypothetical protein OXP11_22260 [Gammaproteobacteria bacterium]|nr:hypothetical protein [Gammaproteobacteria bacterium]